MNEKHLTTVTLLAVLAVGAIGIVGLTKAQTGMTVTNTGNLGSRMCYCEIEHYDYYGNDIGSQIQTLRVKTAGQHTDGACQTRCETQFGRTKRGRKAVVMGWAQPISKR